MLTSITMYHIPLHQVPGLAVCDRGGGLERRPGVCGQGEDALVDISEYEEMKMIVSRWRYSTWTRLTAASASIKPWSCRPTGTMLSPAPGAGGTLPAWSTGEISTVYTVLYTHYISTQSMNI